MVKEGTMAQQNTTFAKRALDIRMSTYVVTRHKYTAAGTKQAQQETSKYAVPFHAYARAHTWAHTDRHTHASNYKRIGG